MYKWLKAVYNNDSRTCVLELHVHVRATQTHEFHQAD